MLLLSGAATDNETEVAEAEAVVAALQRVGRPSNTFRPLNFDSCITAWKESPFAVPVAEE